MQSSLDQMRSEPDVTTNSIAAVPRSRVHGVAPEFLIDMVNTGSAPAPYDTPLAFTLTCSPGTVQAVGAAGATDGLGAAGLAAALEDAAGPAAAFDVVSAAGALPVGVADGFVDGFAGLLADGFGDALPEVGEVLAAFLVSPPVH